MRKNIKGYIYVPLLLSILVLLGFVLSGGLILSKKSPTFDESMKTYTLVDKVVNPSNPTLQLSTLDLIDPDCGCVPPVLIW